MLETTSIVAKVLALECQKQVWFPGWSCYQAVDIWTRHIFCLSSHLITAHSCQTAWVLLGLASLSRTEVRTKDQTSSSTFVYSITDQHAVSTTQTTQVLNPLPWVLQLLKNKVVPVILHYTNTCLMKFWELSGMRLCGLAFNIICKYRLLPYLSLSNDVVSVDYTWKVVRKGSIQMLSLPIKSLKIGEPWCFVV